MYGKYQVSLIDIYTRGGRQKPTVAKLSLWTSRPKVIPLTDLIHLFSNLVILCIIFTCAQHMPL